MKSRNWGYNTEQALHNFPIGVEKMPKALIVALLEIKRAYAIVNGSEEVLAQAKCDAIVHTVDALLEKDFMSYFPLSLWQSGSGTQTNMNVNEVIASFGAVHPNDDVNRGQSTNDVFPAALHLMSLELLLHGVLPALAEVVKTLERLENAHHNLIKTGRTHLQDATPLSFGQEVSGWKDMLIQNIQQIKESLRYLQLLALGGTAVGTGLNTYAGIAEKVCHVLSERYGFEVQPHTNTFAALSSRDALVHAHAALTTCASNVMKIANDIRLLASGPRTGLGELMLPANEKGSSIMPGKVNPTQIEALTMVCIQIMGNHHAMVVANSQGNFQLNAYMPLMAHNMWQSLTLFRDALLSFNTRCLAGLKPIQERMQNNVDHTLMTATILNQHLGYDTATEIVQKAYERQVSIQEVVVGDGYMDEAKFTDIFKVEKMIHPFQK